jgi:hypothetical protein
VKQNVSAGRVIGDFLVLGLKIFERRTAGYGRCGCGSCCDPSAYQILARSESGRTIGSPSLQPQAFANSGMFDSGPFTRHRLGECASVFTC